MATKLIIGAQEADFSERVNVRFSVSDIRNLELGNNNKSFPLTLPLTKTNKAIIGHSDNPGSTDEITDIGRLFVNGIEIIAGKVIVTDIGEDYIKLTITADDWLEDILNTKLRDVDFTAEDHTYNTTNVQGSWTGSDKFYRYPLINFGQPITPVSGSIELTVNDFIPMFRIVDILEYIFTPWTIVSDWITTTLAAKLYILGAEKKANSDFIENKGLQVNVDAVTDNQQVTNIASGGTTDVVLSMLTTVLKDEVTDEGNDFSIITYKYTVPEDGTYRFKWYFSSTGVPGGGSMTVNSSYYLHRILKNGTEIASETKTDASGSTALTTSGTVDTMYLHMEAGDEIIVTSLVRANVTNGGAGAADYTIQLNTASNLTLHWDQWNLYPGIGKTITASDYMPDIMAIDLLKAVKEFANLVFFADRTAQKVYIEPAQTFFTFGNEVDLTNLQDITDEITAENISPNYYKTLILGFMEDTGDKAYTDYISNNDIPDRKEITLTSAYAKEGEGKFINSQLAHTVAGVFSALGVYSLNIPRIYGGQDNVSDVYQFPEFRAAGFKPRLLSWEGLTSGISFDMDGTAYTTYPKADPVDFADLYTNYWINSIHQIDKNQIVVASVRLTASMINQLLNVLNDSEQEGFRPRYKIIVKGQEVYGYLNKVTTDGQVSKCEFIIKK